MVGRGNENQDFECRCGRDCARIRSARADVLAYGATGNDLFGVLDLNTGVFTELGDMGQRLTGLGVAGGVLYGTGYPYSSPNLFTVNPANGALTLVSNSFSAGFYDFGSTTTGLYADGNDGNLYSINPMTGAATLIGPTLLGNFMSTGSNTLFVTGLNDLYSINTTTAAAALVGFPNVGYIDLVAEGGTIYAVSEGLQIYTLNGSNGAATFVANVSGLSDDFFWGLAPDPLSTTPIPAALPLFASGLGMLGLFLWRRKRKNAATLSSSNGVASRGMETSTALLLLSYIAIVLAGGVVQTTAAILPGGSAQDTALREAAVLHNIEGVKTALKKGADANAPSSTGRPITPIGAVVMGTWRMGKDRAADLAKNETAIKLSQGGMSDEEIDKYLAVEITKVLFAAEPILGLMTATFCSNQLPTAMLNWSTC